MIVYYVIVCALAAIGLYTVGEMVAKNVHIYFREEFEGAFLEWGYSRTRTEGHEFRITLLWRWSIVLMTRGKTYAELVEFPYSLNWVIDEFDSSFNELAVASLRYHLDHSVACNEERREQWEALIERLSESYESFTDEEMDVLERAEQEVGDLFQPVYNDDGTVKHYKLRESTPAEKSVYDAERARELAYHERIQQARKDFVDVLPWLWS